MCGHVQRKYAALSTQNVRVITKNCFDMEDVLICGAVALRKTYTRYYNILQDEFSFIIFGKGPYSPSAVFLRHPAFA